MTGHRCRFGPDGHCVTCYERVDALPAAWVGVELEALVDTPAGPLVVRVLDTDRPG